MGFKMDKNYYDHNLKFNNWLFFDSLKLFAQLVLNCLEITNHQHNHWNAQHTEDFCLEIWHGQYKTCNLDLYCLLPDLSINA